MTLAVGHSAPEEWRRRAEDRLGSLGDPSLGFGEAMRLVHELRVHQVELELQNEALREARAEAELGWERYQELYDFAPVGYFTLNPEGVILQVNLAGACLVKAKRVHVINRRFAQFLGVADRLPFLAFLQKGLESLGNHRCEVTMVGDPGGPLTRVRLESSSSIDGEVLRVVATDISQLRDAEAQVSLLNQDLEARVALRTDQLNAANADMQSFCYMISHELRAPLARMEGFSRMIQKLIRTEGLERLPHVAERIEVASLCMREVIDSLLMMTRLSLEQLDPEPVDLSQLARATLETLAAEGRHRPAQVVIAEGVTADGDRRLLGICLRNLLENAIKFTSRTVAARVEFGVAYQGGTPAYFVRDNGVGYDPAHADKLFQAFGRLHRQQDFEGTGIGLNIVGKIIEKHGGHIWGEALPGAGATFFFTLERS